MIEAATPGKLLKEAFRPFLRRFTWAAVYFLVISLIGTIGYLVIEPWDWFESLYMAVTTVTSVGFMEIRPLSPAGRTFTIGLIVLGLTGLGIWWALITALIVELDLIGLFRRRNMLREISRLSHHYIVCGVGRMGRVVMEEMIKSAVPFVVIEKDPECIKELLEIHPRLLSIQDDATKEHTLEAARIGSARGLAACLPSDADNLLLCLTARGLKNDLNIVSRALDEEGLQKMHRAGADHAISPNITGGIRMASTLIRPSVVSFLDVSMTDREMELRLEQAKVPSGSTLNGQTLAAAQIPQRTGLIVLALERASLRGQFLYNPGPDTRLEAGDMMLVLGQPEQLAQLRRYISSSAT